jgi:hypothetical protein
VAAIIGGALLGVAFLGDPGPEVAAATSTPGTPTSEPPAASGAASATPAPSPAPEISAAQTVPIAAIIPNRAIAVVATEGLNLRAAGNPSADLITTLKRGQRLFIIGEPSENAGLRWYRVATTDDPAVCQQECGLIGFVATPLPEADRWVEEAGTDCPGSPMTAEAIGRLQPLEALSCYGRSEIVVTGTMDVPMHGPHSPYRFSPEWLTSQFSSYMRDAGWIWFRAHPDSGLGTPRPGQIVRATGHLEHQAATSCRATVDAGFFGGEVPTVEPLNLARVILDCRATFVWTGYEVLGTEEGLQWPDVPQIPNDGTGGALALAIGETATVQTGGTAFHPEVPCEGEYGGAPIGSTAWWTFTGTGAEVTVDTAGSDFDTIVGVYREDDAGNLHFVGCVDDVDSLQARITVATQVSVRYLVQVGGFNGQTGTLVLALR